MTTDNNKDDYSVIISSVCEVGRSGDVLELVSDWLSPCLKTATTPAHSAVKVIDLKTAEVFYQGLLIAHLSAWLAYYEGNNLGKAKYEICIL